MIPVILGLPEIILRFFSGLSNLLCALTLQSTDPAGMDHKADNHTESRNNGKMVGHEMELAN
jgi:hypothetical protein